MGIVRESRDPFALRTVQLPAPPVDFDFPLPIRTLVIRGDEDAWRAVRGIVVEPLEIRPGPERLTDDTAIRAVRYRDATAYFLDDRAYPEPEAFWVRGARESRVALQSDAPRPAITLRIRNAPVANRVVLASGGWREEFVMAPGEEKLVAVPVAASRGSALVRIETEGGFRPAEQDPASRDQRFLGVWIRIEP